MYVAYLDMILTQREEAAYRALHPENDADIVAPMPYEYG